MNIKKIIFLQFCFIVMPLISMDKSAAQDTYKIDSKSEFLLRDVLHNNVRGVTKWLHKGANSNYKNLRNLKSDEPILHTACRNGNVEIARLSLQHGAQVNALNYRGETALFEAVNVHPFSVHKPYNERVQAILCPFTDNNTFLSEEEATTIIERANKQAERKLIALLIKYKIDINKPNKWNRIPLTSAVFEGNLKTVQFLIQNGAKADENCLNMISPYFTPNAGALHYLCSNNLFPHVEQKFDRRRAVIAAIAFAGIDFIAKNYGDNLEHFLDISYLPGHMITGGSYAITFIAGFFS